jgi:hypothetical protein
MPDRHTPICRDEAGNRDLAGNYCPQAWRFEAFVAQAAGKTGGWIKQTIKLTETRKLA